MNTSIKREGDKTLVIIEGRLDTDSSAAFQELIRPVMEGEDNDIEIDCSGMEYTSSQGLRMFLMLQKHVSARGGRLVLKNMRPQVREIFDITGFSNIIKID